MVKKAIYALFVLLILLGAILVFKFGPSITSATVLDKYSCVSAEAAAELVSDGECVLVDESPVCEKKGLVEIECSKE
ncbi:hypothetical protein GOV06_00565 [Candidatus Woesearchaeota archaeon]|nr:hypothetical protein [Candidatus Woesearchaeota archaeon]